MLRHTVLISVPMFLLACFRMAYSSSAGTRAKETDAALMARAQSELGVTPSESFVVTGLEAATVGLFEVEAGECYQIAVATAPASDSSVEIRPRTALIYPAIELSSSDVNDLSGTAGERVSLSFCADRTAKVDAVFRSSPRFHLGGGGIYPHERTRTFAVAMSHSRETAADRRRRHDRQRAQYRDERRAYCDGRPRSSAAFDCLSELETLLERGDAERAKLESKSDPDSRISTSAPTG